MDYTRKLRGEVHRLIVLKVVERDEAGRPSKCEVGYDDTTFQLADGDEFITAWVPEKVCGKSD